MSLKVSIIIPTFNRTEYLTQAIDSALKQDYPDLEVIVCDNASTDNTPEIIKIYLNNHRFKYYRNKQNIGMVANWRKALIEHATGDYFLILSDDDYLIDESYITKAVKLIKEFQLALVFANGHILYADYHKVAKLALPFSDIEDGKKIFLSRGKIKPQSFILCNVLFNRQLALKLNAFANQYNLSTDSELFLKMCLHGKVGIIKDFVSVYRVHDKNLLKTGKQDLNLLIKNLDAFLEPYEFARRLNIFQDNELAEWRRRVILPAIRSTLISTVANHKRIFSKTQNKLRKKYGRDFIDAQSDIKFQIRLFFARNLPFIYLPLFRALKNLILRVTTTTVKTE